LKWTTGVLAWSSLLVGLARHPRRGGAARIPVRVVFARRRSVDLADLLLFLYLAAAGVGAAVAVGAAIVWAL